MKPEKISKYQMWKLKKEFPTSKTEREQLRILKKINKKIYKHI